MTATSKTRQRKTKRKQVVASLPEPAPITWITANCPVGHVVYVRKDLDGTRCPTCVKIKQALM